MSSLASTTFVDSPSLLTRAAAELDRELLITRWELARVSCARADRGQEHAGGNGYRGRKRQRAHTQDATHRL
jgi:hypothetical protein